MTRYITIPEAIHLVVKEVSQYYRGSQSEDLRLSAEEIDLELVLVFSSDTNSPSGLGPSDVRPLVSMAEDVKDTGGQGSGTSFHRLTLKLRPLVEDGRPLKISPGDIVESWRR